MASDLKSPKGGRVIVIAGPPNAGKDTQVHLLGERLGAIYFSSGDLMRQHNDPDVMSHTNTGALAASDYITKLIGDALSAVPAGKDIVFAGAKKLPEAKWLLDYLPKLGRKLDCVVSLKIEEAESRLRSIKRSEILRRADDATHVQDVRWERYKEDVVPALEMYRRIGLLVEVDALGAPADVAERVWSVAAGN